MSTHAHDLRLGRPRRAPDVEPLARHARGRAGVRAWVLALACCAAGCRDEHAAPGPTPAANSSPSGASAKSGASTAGNPNAATANGASATVPAAAPKLVAPKLVVRARAHGERLDALRAALERLDRPAAESLLDAAPSAGKEEPLLRARFLALDKAGTLESLRLIEVARAADAHDPEVYATAAEIYAANDAFDTAWKEIERGQAACGDAVELVRARGIAWLCREGGASKGVEHLTRARAADATLPYVDRPLAQGLLLLAKEAQKAEKVPLALQHVRASLQLAPDDVDARRLYGELLAASGDFPAAIAVVQGLVSSGVPLEGELASLHKKAGVTALLESDRSRAVQHFRAARAHGLSAEELSSGAIVLAEDARRQIDAAIAALGEHDSVRAEACLREALLDDPDSLAARNHLAVVLYNRGEDREAARLWREVLDTARAEKLDLPDPVHLNLAAALARAGERTEARRVLTEFLEHEPSGDWAARTRQQLAALDAER